MPLLWHVHPEDCFVGSGMTESEFETQGKSSTARVPHAEHGNLHNHSVAVAQKTTLFGVWTGATPQSM